jgi:hypothetical protein
MAHGDAREGKWRGNCRMEWVASTLHATSEHGVSNITTADAHTSAASSRLNWRPRRFKWTRPFRRKTKSGFCACAITFQLPFSPFFAYPGRSWDDLTCIVNVLRFVVWHSWVTMRLKWNVHSQPSDSATFRHDYSTCSIVWYSEKNVTYWMLELFSSWAENLGWQLLRPVL